jgi:hypothetical protein
MAACESNDSFEKLFITQHHCRIDRSRVRRKFKTFPREAPCLFGGPESSGETGARIKCIGVDIEAEKK